MPAASIKICGISTPDALDAAIAGRADHIGLVFFPPSPRHVSLELAASLSARARGKASRVALLVDADDSTIAEVISAASPDVLQLHGKESPERAAQVRAQFGLPVWKAVAIAAAADVEKAASYADATDLVLFDAKTPKGTLPGGMGLKFDWSLLAAWKNRAPWGLAGGLNPENVAEAIRLTGASLVDTSSGVESAPGIKDTARIADFCAAVRTA